MLLFCDSFMHYATGQIGRKWDSVQASPGTLTVGNGNSPAGRGTLTLAGPGGQLGVTKNFPAATPVQFGVRAWLGTPASPTILCAFLYNGSRQFEFAVEPDGTILATRAGAAILRSSVKVPLGAWVYLEARVQTLTSPSGSYQFRCNGADVIPLTSGDCNAAGGNTCNGFQLGNGAFAPALDVTFYFSDLYISNTVGPYNPGFLGDVAVEAVLPNAAGDLSQWSQAGSTASGNYGLVNERNPDDLAGYVTAAAGGTADAYKFASPATPPAQVLALQLAPCAQQIAGTPRQLQLLVRRAGANTVIATDPLSTAWRFVAGVSEQDPQTGAAWTPANLAAAQFGQAIV